MYPSPCLLLPPIHPTFITCVCLCHFPQGALLDAVLSWHLLAVSGILCFDDYSHPDEKQATAKGVDAFLDAYSSELEVLPSEGPQKWVRKVSHSNVIAKYTEHADGSMSVGEVPVDVQFNVSY